MDGVRLKYLQQVAGLSDGKRAVISYSSGWLNGKTGPVAVEGDDVHSFMETIRGVTETELDLIIHSPGGSAQAAEQIMEYLRSQFTYIRCFVPLQAKSAATMIALGCDEIVMGDHSELGPIDPQINRPTPEGLRGGPAHAIIRDFERAQRECAGDVSKLPAWTPILRFYMGGMLEYCTQQVELAMDVVSAWLDRYMLTHDGLSDEERAPKAREIAEHFGSNDSYDRFRTHERPIRIEELQALGVRVNKLEDDNILQDAVLSLFHATDITYNGPIAKIVENHLGRRRVKIQPGVVIAQPQPPQAPPPSPPASPAA
jgi:hypothetical protein